MSGNFYGMFIETLVAILLGLTIGYCIILNKRLARLRSDESAMRGTIGELITATEFAERAINNLRQIARETNDSLGEGLRSAKDVTRELDQQIERGEAVWERIVRVADVAETAARTPPKQAEAPAADAGEIRREEAGPIRSAARTVQAAQAFALRARMRAA